MTGMAFFIVLAFMISAYSVAKNSEDSKNYADLDDLGKSIQQELLLASTLEDGYSRRINIPQTIVGGSFNITNGNIGNIQGYIQFNYATNKPIEIYYITPIFIGNITKGYNTIRKNNGSLYVENN